MDAGNSPARREPCTELLNALERARSRFAVAIAAESKMTPAARLRQYVETDDQMRRYLKQLRSLRRLGLSGDPDWSRLADMLDGPYPGGAGACHTGAQWLCVKLRSVMEKLNERPIEGEAKCGPGRLLSGDAK